MKRITSVSYNLVAKFVAMVFFYLQDILLARVLGIEGYAEWAYFFSVMTIAFWVSNLGINNAVQTTESNVFRAGWNSPLAVKSATGRSNAPADSVKLRDQRLQSGWKKMCVKQFTRAFGVCTSAPPQLF